MGSYKVDISSHKMSDDDSIMKKVHDYHKSVIEEHEKLGLNVVLKSPSVSASDREVIVQDRHSGIKKKTLMFGSNNYIGAITNQNVVDKTVEVIKEYGVGSGGVPINSGTSFYHNELERVLSEMGGFEDTMLFSSGFTANLGVILGLMRPKNLILQDRLNHASLMDGGLMSGSKMIRYKHNDMKSLEKLLADYHDEYKGGILIITDGVFSMDGDIANIPQILKLAKKYGAMLLIDEAHSTGVIGERGKGTLSHFGITDRENIIISGTLSKALGTVGGYISASKEIIDYLRIYARSNLYSTSLPPSVCASAIEAIKYMTSTDVVERLQEKALYMIEQLRKNGHNVMDTVTAVIPIIVSDEHKLTMMSRDLLDRGIYVNCIYPPAVPKNLSRLRVNLNVLLTKEDIDYFVDVMNELAIKYSIPRNI